MKFFLGSFIATFLILFTGGSVFAGGGPVEFTLDPNQALNPGKQYIVHARVYADGPYPTYCTNCYIKLALQNPQASDYIVQNSDVTNEEGRIYAKVISKVPGNRTVYVSELKDSNGTRITANSTVILNYTGESNTNSLVTPQNIRITQIETTADPNTRNVHIMWDPVAGATSYVIYKNAGSAYYYHTTVDTNLYEMSVSTTSTFYISVSAKKNDLESARSEILTIDLAKEQPSNNSAPSGTIYLKVGVQKYLGGPKRQVTLSWNLVPGAVKYNVYTRLADTKDYGGAIVGTGSLSSQVGINAFLDYYVKIDACNSGGCISSYEVFVPKMTKSEEGTVVAPSPSTVLTPPSTVDSKVGELNKKVENLQNQLDKSKKNQSILEQRINELVSFIKRLFPFFK